MSSGQWYIRLGNEEIGPLSNDELRDLALRGGIQPQAPVSQDRTTWVNATTVPGLVFRPQSMPPAMAPVSSLPASPSRFSVGWLVGGIILGGVGVIAIGLLVLIVIGALSPDPQPASFDASTRQAGFDPGQGAPSLAPSPEQIVAENTYRYWLGIRATIAKSGKVNQATPQATTQALRTAAAQIRALPASNVDPDAVQCAISAATVLGNLADHIEQTNNPAIFVQAIIRGAAGDLFGPMADALDADSAMAQQLQQVEAMLANARAVLSSRYGVEFPPL